MASHSAPWADVNNYAGRWLRQTTETDPPLMTISRNPDGDYSVSILHRNGYLTINRSDVGRLGRDRLLMQSSKEFRMLDFETLVQVDEEALHQSPKGIIWKRVPPEDAARAKPPEVDPATVFVQSDAGWTDVAHLSPQKLAIGAALQCLAAVGIFFLFRANDFRYNIGFADNGHIVGVLVSFCGVALPGAMAFTRVRMMQPDGCFLRAGPEGIWYKQPAAALLGRTAEFRIPWRAVTKWNPYSFRINFIPVKKSIVFETFDERTRKVQKHDIAIHPYKERAHQIVANIEKAARPHFDFPMPEFPGQEHKP